MEAEIPNMASQTVLFLFFFLIRLTIICMYFFMFYFVFFIGTNKTAIYNESSLKIDQFRSFSNLKDFSSGH